MLPNGATANHPTFAFLGRGRHRRLVETQGQRLGSNDSTFYDFGLVLVSDRLLRLEIEGLSQ